MFLILVARASATVWEVHRSARGAIRNLTKKYAFVTHSPHISRDYETLRIDMQSLFGHLGITTKAAAA